MKKTAKPKINRAVKVFHSFKEQEEADIKYYKRLSPEKKLEELEQLRIFFIHVPNTLKTSISGLMDRKIF